MKRLLIILFFALLFFSACAGTNQIVDYTIKNTTNYNITIIDKTYNNETEYLINANSSITLKHLCFGKFIIKDTDIPVTIFNDFSCSEIKELKFIELTVYNNSDKNYIIKVINPTFLPDSFNITQKETILRIYTNNLKLQVLYNDKEYFNFILKDNILMLF